MSTTNTASLHQHIHHANDLEQNKDKKKTVLKKVARYNFGHQICKHIHLQHDFHSVNLSI